jgi:hypothetical protein
VLAGFNDLATVRPDILTEWHPSRNLPTTPLEYTFGSHIKVWWKCSEGHEWEASISSRTKTQKPTGCPYCSGNKIQPGFNDLATTHPTLAAQWHPKANTLTTTEVTAGSNRKVWWQCSEGHEWQNTIVNRTAHKQGCPVCANKQVISGVNDIASTNPELLTTWDYTRNTVSPEQVAAGADKKVWWQCEKGHSWEAHLYSRKAGKGCPTCQNRPTLLTQHLYVAEEPALMKEWHHERNTNEGLDPSKITCGSGVKVWWKCEKGHEWEAVVYSRKYGKGCAKCSNRVSKIEREITSFLESHNKTVIPNSRNVISPYELDMYLPEDKIAVEFNGLYWHTETQGKDKWYHHKKWSACKSKGIQLIQIWEDDWNRNPDLVKRMLAHKLGVSSIGKVYARKTTIVSLTSEETRIFLEQNHIQGSVEGSIRIGLSCPKKGLVAVMVLKEENKGKRLNLLRFASSTAVPGGFTKLLKNVLVKNPLCEEIVTFSDHTVSDGDLYRQHGFRNDGDLPPDYMYIVNSERKHKFGYRLKRFKNDSQLKYVEGLSESELAILNNLPRIWDAGKTRWVLEVKPQ